MRAASRPYKPVGWPAHWLALLCSAHWKASKFPPQKIAQNVPQKDSSLRPGPYGESLDFNLNFNYFASPHLDFPILMISNHLIQIQIILPPHTLISQFH